MGDIFGTLLGLCGIICAMAFTIILICITIDMIRNILKD